MVFKVEYPDAERPPEPELLISKTEGARLKVLLQAGSCFYFVQCRSLFLSLCCVRHVEKGGGGYFAHTHDYLGVVLMYDNDVLEQIR